MSKEPQINADERRYNPVMGFRRYFVKRLLPVTNFGASHRKVGYGLLSIDGDEKSFIPERKENRHESLCSLRRDMKKHSLSELRTRMTRIRRIYTDNFNFNPCASVSSAQSVFYYNNSINRVSAFICVHLRLINRIELSKSGRCRL